MVPGRFNWRKYRDQVNIEAVRKRLWDAKKLASVAGSERTGWTLTQPGLEISKQLFADFGQKTVVSKGRIGLKEKQWLAAERRRLLRSEAFQRFSKMGARSVGQREAEAFFRVDDYVLGELRERKIIRVLDAFAEDPKLGAAVTYLAGVVRGGEIAVSTVSDRIVVKSHVARDLLQNAALFKTDHLVVWEYVANGLQYVDSGVNPIVRVTLDSRERRITVSDNGRGMDWSGLQNFFVMHGENQERKLGRPGCGRFGTGKSAAFGIAGVLRVTTVRNKRRSKLELRRTDIEAMSAGTEMPVRCIERQVHIEAPNGTTVEIENIYLKSLDQAAVIRYIERHLAGWPKGCRVFVNNHECEFAEPPVAFERSFRADGRFREKLGDVTLSVKITRAPLEQDYRGVSIYSTPYPRSCARTR